MLHLIFDLTLSIVVLVLCWRSWMQQKFLTKGLEMDGLRNLAIKRILEHLRTDSPIEAPEDAKGVTIH